MCKALGGTRLQRSRPWAGGRSEKVIGTLDSSVEEE